MPGPLIAGHAKIEPDCFDCHAAFSRQSQTSKCLDCHKEIAADRSSGRGFHGRQLEAAKQDCRVCHTDHKGRDADIVQLDRETFDHAVTNFSLQGAHKTTACGDCHAQAVKFRSAPGSLRRLPQDERSAQRSARGELRSVPRRGRLAAREGIQSRRHAGFRSRAHIARSTARRVTPASATPTSRPPASIVIACRTFTWAATAPNAKAATTRQSWRTIQFDHDRTKFPLRGGHAGVKCDTCHTGDLFRDKLATSCVSCHKQHDAHKGQLGSRCEQCHGDAIGARPSPSTTISRDFR